MRYFIIMNPGSAGGKSRGKIPKILDAFKNNSVNFEHRLTNTLEDAYDLSVEANLKGYDVIVAVGGDGTINKVINGFYDSSGRRTSKAKLAVIHTGTSPDFCKSYHIPLNINQAINTVLNGRSRKISTGRITCTRRYDSVLDGRPLCPEYRNVQNCYFACCANIGLGASVARIANSGVRKYLGDTGGTFVSLVQTLFRYRPGNFTVSFDGEQKVLEKVYNIAVGKTNYIASGIKVQHDLSSHDDRLYNLIIKDIRPAEWVSVIRTIYSGKRFTNNHTISLQYSKVIEVFGSRTNPELEFDGDPGGFLPCRIETAHDPLDLICEDQNG